MTNSWKRTPTRRRQTLSIPELRRSAALTAGVLALGPRPGNPRSPVLHSPIGETTIVFDAAEGTTEFGDPWTVGVTVGNRQSGPLAADVGTVDLFIEGIAGTFVGDVPLLRGGDAFVTAPLGEPALPAGTYRLFAAFVPDVRSGLVASQTTTPYTLTVEAVPLAAQATWSRPAIRPLPSFD